MSDFIESIYNILYSITDFLVTIVETLFKVISNVVNYVWSFITTLQQIIPTQVMSMVIIIILISFVLFVINRK